MCGIAGFFNTQIACPEAVVANMAQSLTHRGPDATGTASFDFNGRCTALGHTRLSVLDLSATANQPFYSACGRYVIVYNGEIYNFRELKSQFGLTAHTSCDTEIVLELFVRQGPEFVHLLNGMFAFVIYDLMENKLYLFRDRVGVKPLFYYFNDNELFFASEIKSLLTVDQIKNRLSLNSQAVNLYFHLGYIPQPHTIYKEICKFPPGAYAIVQHGSFDLTHYWQPEKKVEASAFSDYPSAKRHLHELLKSSVAYRMVSDVPVGTFLSGGIDSSLVTAIASTVSDFPVKSFSIGFKEAHFNEAVYAGKVAKHLQTDHTEYILSEKDALDHLLPVMDQFDEPFADSSALPVYLVSSIAQKDVRVVLTGDGGDECFLGYGAYTWAERMNNPFLFAFRKPASFFLKSIKSNRIKRVGDLVGSPSKGLLKEHIFSQEQYYFSYQEIEQLLSPNYWEQQDSISAICVKRKLSVAEEQALFDLKYYLPDDLLVKVDRASMKCSLEAREPLLDYRLIEFALNLSYGLKVRKGDSKFLLKQVLHEYLPEAFFQRPKRGFSIPLGDWLKKDLSELLDKYLSKSVVEGAGVLNFSYIDSLKKRFLAGEDYLFHRLWLIIIFHRWAERSIFIPNAVN
ncbi:asparagine synthase (glutamine-hydrolyzing) [Cytophagaceae bacterium ABcell3]|nr:asparagine synthase (glutamine-hydrolyzing) [Cytophagaceae bacterium ABcell3]